MTKWNVDAMKNGTAKTQHEREMRFRSPLWFIQFSCHPHQFRVVLISFPSRVLPPTKKTHSTTGSLCKNFNKFKFWCQKASSKFFFRNQSTGLLDFKSQFHRFSKPGISSTRLCIPPYTSKVYKTNRHQYWNTKATN